MSKRLRYWKVEVEDGAVTIRARYREPNALGGVTVAEATRNGNLREVLLRQLKVADAVHTEAEVALQHAVDAEREVWAVNLPDTIQNRVRNWAGARVERAREDVAQAEAEVAALETLVGEVRK